MYLLFQLRLIRASLLLLMIGPLLAIAPKRYSDEELADFPIMVVAQWEKAAFRSHAQKRKDENGETVVERWEFYTKLKIIRIIKGDGVALGEHDLKGGFGIAWNEDGKGLQSGTSTEVLGDVDDVTVPRIWFLKRARSWDAKDQTEYLSISNYRAIQDLKLESFFRAVGSENPAETVIEFLDSDHREVVLSALRLLCGGREPWALGLLRSEPARFYDLQLKGAVLKDAVEKIRGLITKSSHEDLEPNFIAAYAELADKVDWEFVKTFLSSENIDSRVVATCLLIRGKQGFNPDEIELKGGGTNLILRMIKEIKKSNELRLAPLLIGQLENGTSAGYRGSDHFIPALKAKSALMQLTGCVFPFDVALSRQAWEAARLEKRFGRIQMVSKLAPAVEMPFRAEVRGTAKSPQLRLTNTSSIPTMIPSQPSMLSQSAPGISAVGHPGTAGGPKYQVIAPDGFLDFPIEIKDRLLLFPADQRSIKMEFLNNGGEAGPRAWIGVVTATFGDDWAEERLEEKVKKRWPNGYFKMVGQTVNGERVGDWEFFNEKGDRIKKVAYTNGGSAEYNSEHPNNKGAGIPKKVEGK